MLNVNIKNIKKYITPSKETSSYVRVHLLITSNYATLETIQLIREILFDIIKNDIIKKRGIPGGKVRRSTLYIS